MPVKRLPSDPNLKREAKDLLKARGARATHKRLGESGNFIHVSVKPGTLPSSGYRFQLRDAQLTIAREYGFSSWARLKRHIEKPGSETTWPCARTSGSKTPHFGSPWTCSIQGTPEVYATIC
jgi:hypothetical protein